jgi:hypothetical protein
MFFPKELILMSSYKNIDSDELALFLVSVE